MDFGKNTILRCFKCTVAGGNIANATSVDTYADIPQALLCLGMAKAPVIVLVGGAGMVSEIDAKRLQGFFSDVVAPAAQSLGASVIDGGTNTGVMRCIGIARQKINGDFPLLGVAAIGTIIEPGRSAIPTEIPTLACNHSHFILVPGNDWGDESPWMAQIGSALSDGFGSLTLVVNGGEITWSDVSCSVNQKRVALVVSGSGRAADCLAVTLKGKRTDARAESLAASGYVQTVSIKDSRVKFESSIRSLLKG